MWCCWESSREERRDGNLAATEGIMGLRSDDDMHSAYVKVFGFRVYRGLHGPHGRYDRSPT